VRIVTTICEVKKKFFSNYYLFNFNNNLNSVNKEDNQLDATRCGGTPLPKYRRATY
jgi:hypothetical protein